MGNKIDKLYTAARTKIAEMIQQRNKYLEEISRLQGETNRLSEVIDKALSDGDLPTYKKANEEKAQAEFDIATMRKFVNDIGSMKIEDFADVWESFIEEYESEFKKAFREYKAARKELYKQYQALYQMQKKAVSLRHSIASACGLYCPSYVDSDYSEYASIGTFSGFEKNPVRNIATRLSPDAAFFAAIGEIPEELDQETYRVIKCNNP